MCCVWVGTVRTSMWFSSLHHQFHAHVISEPSPPNSGPHSINTISSSALSLDVLVTTVETRAHGILTGSSTITLFTHLGMALGHLPQSATRNRHPTTQETKNSPSKRRRASSADISIKKHILTPIATDKSTDTSSSKPVTTSATAIDLPLHVFKEATLRAEAARKAQQQASQLVFQKADAFILELNQLGLSNHLETRQATVLIQQFTLKMAQALANGNIANLIASSQEANPLTALEPTPTSQSHSPHQQPSSETKASTTWATVAANNELTNRPTTPPDMAKIQTSTSNVNGPQANQQKVDNRLFVCLSPEHNLRQLHPYHIQKHLVPALDKVHVSSIHITPTGLALKPRTEEDAQALHKKKEEIKELCGAKAVETADPWTKLRLPSAPHWLITLDGRKEASIDEVRAEVTRAFNACPIQICWGTSHRSEQLQDSCPLLVDFHKADLPSPPAEAQLFFTRVPFQARITTKKPMQCNRCWAFHWPETCSRHQRCVYYTATRHKSEQHEQKTLSTPACGAAAGQCRCPNRCANCNGPHEATNEQCPLRPHPNAARKTSKETASIRQAGHAQRMAINSCNSQPPSQQQNHDISRNA